MENIAHWQKTSLPDARARRKQRKRWCVSEAALSIWTFGQKTNQTILCNFPPAIWG